MENSKIISDFIRFCEANKNPLIVEKYKRYFKEGYDAYGLSTEIFHAKVKEIIMELAPDYNESVNLSIELTKSAKYELVSFGILLLMSNKKYFSQDTLVVISKWFDNGINNWAHTDFICGDLFEILFKNKFISFMDLSEWRYAQNKFKRRAVPVSLLKLLKLTDDYMPLLTFIEPLMLDKERPVQQGCGWFLREAWRKQPDITELFLLKWKDTAPRLIFQYALEKMEKSEREKFRKSK